MKNALQQGVKARSAILSLMLITLVLLPLAGCANDRQPVSSSFAIESERTRESINYLEVNLNVPILSGFDSAEALNEEIADSIAAARAEAEDAAVQMEADQSQLKAGLTMDYLYSQNGDIISLWLMFSNYTGGAHGLYWIEPYTFNISTGERYDFSGLFREGNASASLVADKIIEAIRNNPDLYFESAELTVKNYQNGFEFYINGDQLTVFFSLYDITAYAGGIQFFDFDAEELKDLLKPEIYDSIKDATPVNTDGTIAEH